MSAFKQLCSLLPLLLLFISVWCLSFTLSCVLTKPSHILLFPTLKLNQFHFHTCVWWDNYSQLNRAQSLKTHLYTLFVFFFLSSHSATVCEMKSIPPATLLPSKSVLIITAASTCTHTKMDKQRISALTGSHICPHLYSINLSSSFQCWMLLCQPCYPNTHTHAQRSAVRWGIILRACEWKAGNGWRKWNIFFKCSSGSPLCLHQFSFPPV